LSRSKSHQRIIETLIHSQTCGDLLHDIQTALDQLGWSGFLALAKIPNPNDALLIKEPTADMVLSTYPQSWLDRYLDQNYESIDPTVDLAFAAPRSIHWASSLYEDSENPNVRQLFAEAREHGLHHGRTIPLFRLPGLTFACGVATDDPRPSQDTQTLTEVMNTAAERLRYLTRPSVLSHVSERELDVLGWVAAGKTAEEIALILDIKTRTVQFHIQSLKDKLQASTLAHLVHLAHQLGLLA
jgi:LuxR family transcriptional activator of conjugal transfer of Ti plasmids